jgi:hypothetical protein
MFFLILSLGAVDLGFFFGIFAFHLSRIQLTSATGGFISKNT